MSEMRQFEISRERDNLRSPRLDPSTGSSILSISPSRPVAMTARRSIDQPCQDDARRTRSEERRVGKEC